jgi:hypothetical protein
MSTLQFTNIVSSDILIHSEKASLPLIDIGEDEYFGILKTNIDKTRMVKTPTLMKFTIDKTGSMNEHQTRKTTKMDYVVQTFISMMEYLSKLDAEIFVQVNTFNITVDELIQCVRITPDNLDEMINKIKSIRADESTDIGLAMEKANEELVEYAEENPEHQIGHIFMTDGDQTRNVKTVSELTELVNSKYNNILVGFGIDHNVDLLSNMADKKNAEYKFVDNMENTSLVYGETVHKFIYPALRNVEFRIENGKLYDWKKNEWTDCLYEDVIIGEAEKVYHIKTTDPSNVLVNIHGSLASLPVTVEITDFDKEFRLLDTAIPIPDLVTIATGDIISNDLTKYAFRQKVQELLFRAKSIKYNSISTFKSELRDAFRTIRKYMRMNLLLNDGLLKMICDDIVITYRTIGLGNGRAFAVARQTSQGRQQSYNTGSSQTSNKSDTVDLQRQNALGPDMFDFVPSTPRPVLKRMNTISPRVADERFSASLPNSDDELNVDTFTKYDERGFFHPPASVFKNIFKDDNYLPEDEIESYLPSTNYTTCYATPDVLQTMRTMSKRNP